MPGDGAVMKRSANGLPSPAMRLKARDLALDRRGVVIVQFALRFRRVLLPADVRKAAREILHQLGELLELAAAAALRFAGKARHALRHVGLKADPLLLAVVADVDAGFFLLGDHMADRLVHFGVELRRVVAFAGFAPDQKLAQRFAARQAADMGGEDAVAADNHGTGSGRQVLLSDALSHSAIMPLLTLPCREFCTSA